MGIAGAGLSTACSQAVSFLILLSMFLRGKTITIVRGLYKIEEAQPIALVLAGISAVPFMVWFFHLPEMCPHPREQKILQDGGMAQTIEHGVWKRCPVHGR